MAGRREERWQHWRGVISEYQSSSMTVAEFCRQRKVSEASFYAWRRKMSAASSSADDASPSPPTSTPLFVSLPLADSGAEAGHFEVRLPNGICVGVPPKFELSVLASLLQAVTAIESGHA